MAGGPLQSLADGGGRASPRRQRHFAGSTGSFRQTLSSSAEYRPAVMRSSVVLKVAAPALSLGVLLFALSVFAAWKIHLQQTRHSEMVAREVYGLQAVGELHITMREIRYQLNLFLRTRDRRHLRGAVALDAEAWRQLATASSLVRNTREHELIEDVADGYRRFHATLTEIVAPLLVTKPSDSDPGEDVSSAGIRALTELADDRLTEDVLTPLFESVVVNREVLDRMDEAGIRTARQLTIGLLVLGACGAAAGLLLGVAGSRAVADRLRRSETELLRREQLAQVGQLAAGMAHELRNPLMPMKMLVQAALERRDIGLAGRSLHVVNEEITRLEKSIQGFLDFARPALPQKACIDVRQVIMPTLDLVSGRAARQGITVAARLPQDPATACVDRGQIRQLLLNLVLNAMDAMAEGGRIEVQVEPLPAGGQSPGSGPVVASAAIGPGTGLAIRVVDDGPGVNGAVLPHVFEPFVTTKEAGAGLGLSLCARIAAVHGGRLTARNLVPRGSEFAVELPVDAVA